MYLLNCWPKFVYSQIDLPIIMIIQTGRSSYYYAVNKVSIINILFDRSPNLRALTRTSHPSCPTKPSSDNLSGPISTLANSVSVIIIKYSSTAQST